MDALISLLEERQEAEKASLQEEIQSMLKGAKKSKKRDLETKAMQMEYDLRARHIEESDFLEEHGCEEHTDDACHAVQSLVQYMFIIQDFESDEKSVSVSRQNEKKVQSLEMKTSAPLENNDNDDDELRDLSKKEKSQRKKDKKLQREREKEEERDRLRVAMSDLPSQRLEEQAALNQQLRAEGLQIQDVAADGHCMYRAIANQLQQHHAANVNTGHLIDCGHELSSISFAAVRKLAANYMRSNVDIYAPFLALPGPCTEYDAYCDGVESVAAANWGGQTELSALAACLRVPIWVYEVGRPVLKMGEEEGGGGSDVSPLRVSYHRHFYALGEHYNSVRRALAEAEGEEGGGVSS